MNHEALAREMRELREQVPGITDTAVAAAEDTLRRARLELLMALGRFP